MRLLLSLLIAVMLTGCASVSTVPATEPAVVAKVSKIKARADHLGKVGAVILRRVGPLVTAGTCIAAPEYCVAAKAAYKAAATTVVAIQAVKEADDGVKLATLAEEFVKNMDTVNSVLVATGQPEINLGEFQGTVKELAAETAR